jgi:hypothetical protein
MKNIRIQLRIESEVELELAQGLALDNRAEARASVCLLWTNFNL